MTLSTAALNIKRLLKLYPKAEAVDNMLRIDAYTVVEVSETHVHQCEVFAAGLGHAINVFSSLGFEYRLDDLPALQKICARLSELQVRGAQCRFRPSRPAQSTASRRQHRRARLRSRSRVLKSSCASG